MKERSGLYEMKTILLQVLIQMTKHLLDILIHLRYNIELTWHSVELHTHGPTAGPIHTSSIVNIEAEPISAEPISPCSSISVMTGSLQVQPPEIINHHKNNVMCLN